MNGANSDNGVSIQKMVTPDMVGRNMVTPNLYIIALSPVQQI